MAQYNRLKELNNNKNRQKDDVETAPPLKNDKEIEDLKKNELDSETNIDSGSTATEVGTVKSGD